MPYIFFVFIIIIKIFKYYLLIVLIEVKQFLIFCMVTHTLSNLIIILNAQN